MGAKRLIPTVALFAMVALTACQTASGSFCDIAKPIRPSVEQIDQMTDAQVRELLAHNRKGQRLCSWNPYTAGRGRAPTQSPTLTNTIKRGDRNG